MEKPIISAHPPKIFQISGFYEKLEDLASAVSVFHAAPSGQRQEGAASFKWGLWLLVINNFAARLLLILATCLAPVHEL